MSNLGPIYLLPQNLLEISEAKNFGILNDIRLSPCIHCELRGQQ